MEIAIWGADAPAKNTIDTPFGPASFSVVTMGGREAGLFRRDGDPRARTVAAKELGAERIIGVFNGAALNRLLKPGDCLIPDDLIDQTRGGPTTFFTTRGLGYVQMTPPFCSETRAALVSGARAGRLFDLGTAVACPPRPITPAEAKAWRALGGDVAVWGLAPEWSLARELELCYAALVVVSESLTADQIAPFIAALPAERQCNCARLNPGAHRELGDDWRKWLT
jgi:5'-methylthioadenosine phosphorylase